MAKNVHFQNNYPPGRAIFQLVGQNSPGWAICQHCVQTELIPPWAVPKFRPAKVNRFKMVNAKILLTKGVFWLGNIRKQARKPRATLV